MSELLRFPFKNQLSSPTFDGRADENSHMNCVPSCISAGLQYFTGKDYEPDELKDAVYGESYEGGTAAVAYVSYCAKQGVSLSPINGSPSYLVPQIHAHLAEGHVVIGTIPSTYQPPSNPLDPGMSHVIAFYKDSAGVLIAMNPWEAFAQSGTDDWWGARLCFNQVWVMQKVAAPPKKGTLPLNIPQGWHDDGKTLTAPNGKKVVMGFRQWVLAHAWHPDDVPLEDEHGYQQGTAQLFMSRRLCWDSKRGVFEEQLGSDVLSAESAVHTVQADYENALKQKVQAESLVKSAQADLQSSLNVNNQLHAQIDALSKQIEDLKAQLEDEPTPPKVPVVTATPIASPGLKPKLELLEQYLQDLIQSVS